MKTKNLILGLILTILFSGHLFAQTGVSITEDNSQADESAMLDVKSDSKGILIPRVNLISVEDVSTIPTPAHGLLVYNSEGNLPVGIYHWNNIIQKWNYLVTSNDIVDYGSKNIITVAERTKQIGRAHV